MSDDHDKNLLDLVTSIGGADAIGSISALRKLFGLETGHERWTALADESWRSWVTDTLIGLTERLDKDYQNVPPADRPTIDDVGVRFLAVRPLVAGAGNEGKRNHVRNAVFHSLHPDAQKRGFERGLFDAMDKHSSEALDVLLRVRTCTQNRRSAEIEELASSGFGPDTRYHLRELWDARLIYVVGESSPNENQWAMVNLRVSLTVKGEMLCRLLTG